MPLHRHDDDSRSSSCSIDTIDELCELQYESELQQLQKQKARAEELQRKRSNSFGKRLTRLLSFEPSFVVEKRKSLPAATAEDERYPPRATRILMNSLRKLTRSRSSEVGLFLSGSISKFCKTGKFQFLKFSANPANRQKSNLRNLPEKRELPKIIKFKIRQIRQS